MIDLDFLSIWEVSFRWAGLNPYEYPTFNPEDPEYKETPIEFHDNVRNISSGVGGHHLKLYWEDCLMDSEGMENLVYMEFREDEDQHRIISSGDRYTRELLMDSYISRDEFHQWLYLKGREFPDFWFKPTNSQSHIDNRQQQEQPKNTDDEFFNGRHAESKLDRERCRAIASTLWLEHPELTIEAVTKHEAIKRFGNGLHYGGKHTLRSWIKDLKPRQHS